MKPLSWKARRRGDLYCSPACGGACTWAAYTKAKAEAVALTKRLGPGWKSRVWENLGWHYEARDSSGLISVSCRGGTYTAIFNGQWVSYGRTPKSVVKKVVREARENVARLSAAIACVTASKYPPGGHK
jgi:hypothetical protein